MEELVKQGSPLKPKVGELVIVADDAVKGEYWNLGLITQVSDNRKTATVKVLKNNNDQTEKTDKKWKEVDRAVNKLIPLEIRPLRAQSNREQSSAPNQSSKFACFDCPEVCKTSKEFVKHIATHKGYRRHKCSYCDKRFPQLCEIRRHEREKPFKSQTCDASFAQQNSLAGHQRIHIGKRPFECENCGKSFSDHSNNVRHHTGERPFKCQDCDKTFSDKTSHVKHRTTHTDEKPFECKSCGKTFARSNTLQTHILTHTGERPFKCESCKASFSQHAHLSGHQRLHTGERSYQCENCGKSFSQHAHYVKHRRIHTGDKPFECKFCGKKFAQSSALKSHIFTHTGAKPHLCHFCDKGFSQKSYIKTHISSQHSGDNPYLCLNCKKKFPSRDEMVKHRQQIHGNKDNTKNDTQSLNNDVSSDENMDFDDEDAEVIGSNGGDREGENVSEEHETAEKSKEVVNKEISIEVKEVDTKENSIQNSPFPLSLGVMNRSIAKPEELMIVWISKLEDDLIVAAGLNPRQTIICVPNLQKQTDKRKRFLKNDNKVSFHMLNSDGKCSLWTAICFGDQIPPAELEDQFFRNFKDVERIFANYAKSKGMTLKNVMRHTDDLFQILAEQLSTQIMAFNFSEDN